MAHTPDHRDQAKSRLSHVGQRYFDLIEFDDNEELVTEIRKHPFGAFLIEISGTIISLIVMFAIIIIALNLDQLGLANAGSEAAVRAFLIGAGFILGIFGLIMTVISMIIYRSNVIFVTTEKLAQVVYQNIIDRKISQLSIGDVQDVTVSQKGIFARLFNYGTLVVETAGEQQNYTFTYVPKPYENAKGIVNAHEENLKAFGN